MKNLIRFKLFESELKSVNIADVCDIFTHLIDQTRIHIWQFPVHDGRKWGPMEKSDQLTYDGTKGNRFSKLVQNKEYWFEISADINQIQIDDPDNTTKKEISNFIENYDYDTIISKLDNIGIEIYNIERKTSDWVISN